MSTTGYAQTPPVRTGVSFIDIRSQPHLADSPSMGRGAANRVPLGGVDRGVEVRAFGAKRIVTCCAQNLARLPPAMFANDNARIQLVVQSSAGPHGADGRIQGDPAAG